MNQPLGEEHRVSKLTTRQKEILRLFAKHHQAKEISRILNISVPTIKEHSAEARKRLGVDSTRAAAVLLVTYEQDFNPLPEGGHTPRRVTSEPDNMPISEHELRLLPRQELPDYQLQRARNSLDDVGVTEQNSRDSIDSGVNSNFEHGSRAKQGFNDFIGSVGLANRRRGSSGRLAQFWLEMKTLSSIRWVGLVVVVALVSVFMAVAFASSLMGLFAFLHQANLQFIGHD